MQIDKDVGIIDKLTKDPISQALGGAPFLSSGENAIEIDTIK